jgi:SAM-dependent methyltransferase
MGRINVRAVAPNMSPSLLASERFPLASKYHPDWILAGVSGGANCLWLAEWLALAMDLRPGMRVLDLGCGRALSSIFLHREFGVQVWANDLWFGASENLRRVRDAGAGDGVFPIHADARALPFAAEFFDAVLSIDSFLYYGTDDHYLGYVTRLLRPGGRIGIAQVGLTRDMDGPPEHLREWWHRDQLWGLRSPAWWRRHWGRTDIVDVETADLMPDGWRCWLDWLRVVAPDNTEEAAALEADAGTHLGYVRAVARRREGVPLPEAITSVPTEYRRAPLLRGPDAGAASTV